MKTKSRNDIVSKMSLTGMLGGNNNVTSRKRFGPLNKEVIPIKLPNLNNLTLRN